jgi:AraC-like DNA-binding protein/cbb3-type cytochrome oxidase subunit 3
MIKAFIKIFSFFLCLILSVIHLYGQNNKKFIDLTYEEIEKKLDNSNTKQKEVSALINLYIEKSKWEKNDESLIYAYRYASKFYSAPENYKYADSALFVGQKSKNKKLLTDAYLNKGVVLMDNSHYKEALDNILIANKYSLELNNDYITNKTIYYIAQNKIYLGLYEDANKELKICINYFRKNLTNNELGKDYEIYYIYSLMSLIDSNTRIGQHSSNQLLFKEAYNYLKLKNKEQYFPYFISSEGTDAFYNKDYNKAIKKLSEAIKLYNDQWPHVTEIFYLGLSNWKLGRQGVAVKYFEEIDKEYERSKKLNPEFRSAYELLIKYNDSIGNTDKQLEYINKLMSLDRSYEKNYKYLYTKINKEYDTQKLITEKNRIESSLKTQRAVISSLLLIAVIIISLVGYRYYHLQKVYKDRFNEIIAKKDVDSTTNLPQEKALEVKPSSEADFSIKPKNFFDVEYYNKIPGLNPLFVESILNQLHVFEKENKFLDNQISQKMLSESLGTNSTYLSKIINVYKGKSFNHYINDLRIDYIIEFMKNDAKYLNIDVKELATMAGFTNAISFSDNFQRKYQIKPSFFIKMMKENMRSSAIED